jgi:uncharacterized BrkB/YihY/UPF0761 family membrane protein
MALPLLQIPGGAEIVVLLLMLVFFVVGLAILIGATYWVYNDAQKRGNDNAALWAVLTALGFFIGLIPGLVVVVVYVVVRE